MLNRKELEITLEMLKKEYIKALEKGNRKINTNPKTAKSLVTNLNNAVNNSAANGCASEWFSLKEI